MDSFLCLLAEHQSQLLLPALIIWKLLLELYGPSRTYFLFWASISHSTISVEIHGKDVTVTGSLPTTPTPQPRTQCNMGSMHKQN